MVLYRFGRWRYSIGPRALRMPLSFFYKLLKPVSEILTGIELPCETTVGRRFRIDHFGGIIISGDAVSATIASCAMASRWVSVRRGSAALR